MLQYKYSHQGLILKVSCLQTKPKETIMRAHKEAMDLDKNAIKLIQI